MKFSYSTQVLLSQHLYWVTNGYDVNGINGIIGSIRKENPFVSPSIDNVIKRTGQFTCTDFQLKELKELTYLYAMLFKLDFDLSYLEHCTSLIEVDFSCSNIENIESFKYLINLKNLNLNNTNVTNIDSLKHLENMETLVLKNCIIDSLIPLKHYKKLSKIVLDLVNNEEEILEVISNQANCNAEYLINNYNDIGGLSFHQYWMFINLKEESLEIEMHSLEKSKYENFYQIPLELQNDENFKEIYSKIFQLELDKRVNLVLRDNYEILSKESYNYSEEISYVSSLKIRRNKA